MKPTRPGSGVPGENVAFKLISGSVLRIPMQFGPISRIPWVRQSASSSSWSARPASPVSEKPDVMTTRPRTPFVPQDPATSITAEAGTHTMAMSTSPGTSSTLGEAATPSIALAFGLTGCTTPWKPERRMLRKTRAPIDAGSREAPITATERGERSAATAFRAASRSRSSNERAASSVISVGNSISTDPGRARIVGSKPQSRKTSIMRWFAGAT